MSIRAFVLLLLIPFTLPAQVHKDIHQFIDAWHLAAANANADVFFGSIADDGVYIGTADFERWTKSEFMKFAEPYFKRGKAWDFKPYDREVHVSSSGEHAWFSEL